MPSSKRNTGKAGYTKAEREVLAKAKEIIGPSRPRPPRDTKRLEWEKEQRRKKGRRKCGGKNIRGEPCGAIPLNKGTEIEGVTVDGKWCLRHDPNVPEGAFLRIVQDRGHQSLSKKGRLRRPLEVLGQAVVEAPGLLAEPYLKALGLEWDSETEELRKVNDGAKIVGFSREGYARRSRHDDLELQMRAAERLFDRVFGKARQALDIGASGSGMVGIVIPQTAERARIVLDVLQEAGALPNGNGNGNHADAEIEDADVVED